MLPGGPIRRRSEIVRENCPRFRILVMGKRNAGKTTILHKMTDTTDGIVYVHDPQGQPVDPAVIQPSVERGMSNIRNEVTFPTSPGFVFHDSRGIEAGSREEIDTLQQFIAERAAEDNIQKRLHVIWYCLPLDNDRPLSDEEMRFFETGTHDVPVVAIFTKCEWRVAKAFASLRSQGLHIPRAQKEAPDIAMKDIEKIVENRFAATKYRPAGFVRLSKMHEPGSGCTDLMDRTAQVIDGEVLDHLFAAVRQKAIEVSMRAALRVVIWDMQRTHRPISERDVVKVLLFFPRWFNSEVFSPHRRAASPSSVVLQDPAWATYEWVDDVAVDWLFDEQARKSPVLLAEAAETWFRPGDSNDLRRLIAFIYACILAECLAWDGGDEPWRLLPQAIEQCRQSQLAKVGDFVRQIYPTIRRESRTTLVHKIMDALSDSRLRLDT